MSAIRQASLSGDAISAAVGMPLATHGVNGVAVPFAGLR